eukprot:m.430640 g.430640  ORF g.430640 m.430640 type:complete len:250 (-) comp17193_c0_seq1:80-829(-)
MRIKDQALWARTVLQITSLETMAALAGLRRAAVGAARAPARLAAAHVPMLDQRREKHVDVPHEAFEPYKTSTTGVASAGESRRAFQYVVATGLGVTTIAAAKVIVTNFLDTMSTSADVKAMAQLEVELDTIAEGKNVVLKWQGKPLFVRHRTAQEIATAVGTDIKDLKDAVNDPADSDRTKDPKWLVLLGICTHLGCVPISHAGEYGGYFCPCHGSHYDISGRIRKGPAPFNLEIPPYKFQGDNLLVVG